MNLLNLSVIFKHYKLCWKRKYSLVLLTCTFRFKSSQLTPNPCNHFLGVGSKTPQQRQKVIHLFCKTYRDNPCCNKKGAICLFITNLCFSEIYVIVSIKDRLLFKWLFIVTNLYNKTAKLSLYNNCKKLFLQIIKTCPLKKEDTAIMLMSDIISFL